MMTATADLIARLTREHDAIRMLADRFDALLTIDAPADIDNVSTARWELTKAILTHVAYEDRHAFLPLERDPRAHVATVARRFKAELETLQYSIEAHMGKWSSGATTDDWRGYRDLARQRTQLLLDRMRREERELFPNLADNAEIATGAVPPAVQRNWARAAWDVQDSLKQR